MSLRTSADENRDPRISATESRLHAMQRDQIFLGLVGARISPKPTVRCCLRAAGRLQNTLLFAQRVSGGGRPVFSLPLNPARTQRPYWPARLRVRLCLAWLSPPVLSASVLFVAHCCTHVQTQAKVVDALMKAGIRFVYSSPYNYRRTKRLASKMGLETDWNCAISLREDKVVRTGKPQRRTRDRRAEGPADVSGAEPGGCFAQPLCEHPPPPRTASL